MDEVKLKIQKRAVPSRGRARLHKSMLAELGAEEESKLEIINEASGESVTVTLFADSMVEEGYIRLSAEDLEALGLLENDTVAIRKKPPLSEAIKKEAGEVVERVSEGVERVKETVEAGVGKARKETVEAADTVKGGVVKGYGRIVEEVTPVAGRIEGVTRETVARIREEVAPVTEKVETKARKAYERIAESPIRERLSKTAESVINMLKPGEEAKLKKMLEECMGDIQTVTVSSDMAADKLIREIDLPSEVVIAAVQRNKEIIIPEDDTRLVKGDIVYVVGKLESLRLCREVMEG